jgi:malonyl-CoA O-methyltransferase
MTKPNPDLPDHDAVRAAFDREAGRYDRHAALEREVGSRLMERLEFQRRTPELILDLGSGTGLFSSALKRRFRKAEVVGLDASMAMSQALSRRSGFRHPLRAVCADLSHLPFADRSADLLFSNLALQWSQNFGSLIAEFRRVLGPGGLLLFSGLGPDSLKEFKSAAGYTKASARVRHFVDMHDIGDALLAAGFAEPVMDSEFITIEFRQFDRLVTELEATGASMHFGEWAGLTKPGAQLAEAYQAFCRDGRYPVTWEIVYGAAFGPEEGQPMKTQEGDVAAFSVDFLRRSLKHR